MLRSSADEDGGAMTDRLRYLWSYVVAYGPIVALVVIVALMGVGFAYGVESVP